MFRMNGNGHQASIIVLNLIDSLLIVGGVLAGTDLTFQGFSWSGLGLWNFLFRIMVIVGVLQLTFYCFDLYNVKYFREREKLILRLLASLGTSFVILSAVHYLLPPLKTGRDTLAICMVLVSPFAFLSRRFLDQFLQTRAFRERILVIGTGRLAKEINHAINGNGYHGFEIVGFIDESGQRIGQDIE
jgi:FlaA1/EpsC-like NDP-sugar epimerase